MRESHDSDKKSNTLFEVTSEMRVIIISFFIFHFEMNIVF